MLKIDNLRKSFGDTEVLKGISFELKKGEIGVVLGKSGAGKTTLLRCINGLESFDEGYMEIDSIKVDSSNNREGLRGKVGMVFQNFNLFPHMTVMENIIASPTLVFKEDVNQAKEKAMKLLNMVDLEEKADAYPHELSGGQQQRVAIARSCALNPKVLCFDEPTSALDPETVKRIVEIIKRFSSTGMTVLIITHDIPFAEMTGGKIISIVDGRIDE